MKRYILKCKDKQGNLFDITLYAINEDEASRYALLYWYAWSVVSVVERIGM